MKMHSYYTEIPLRSFDAIVKKGYLSEVLMALLVDPLEAEDVADSIYRKTETAIKLEVSDRVFSAPIGLTDFQNLPSKDAFEKLRITLSQWVMRTDGANDALRELTMWDLRFGAWCACAVAREALRCVPKGEQRPLRAIETAEAWVAGRAGPDDVRRAAAAAAAADAAAAAAAAAYAAAAAAAAAYAAAYAAADAAFATSLAANDAVYAASASASAANDAVYASLKWSRIREAELIRLREVVANACLTFPG